MNFERHAPSQALDSSSSFTDADRLRALLKRAGLSQRAAAGVLNVEERTMRQWCAGQGKPPTSVFRALSPRLTHSENLRRLIELNESVIAAMQEGRISGLGYVRGPSDRHSVTTEINRLRKLNEEHRALLRLDEAFQRQQEALFNLNEQLLPFGNGLPKDESVTELNAAQEEFRAAKAEVDRIAQKIRAG